MKRPFEEPIAKVREELQSIDSGCPHIHHIKPRGMDEGLALTEVIKAGHPHPCGSGMCNSTLRILRAASVHYPVLCKFLHAIYAVRIHHSNVAEIDNALCTYNYKALWKLLHIEEYEDLLFTRGGNISTVFH